MFEVGRYVLSPCAIPTGASAVVVLALGLMVVARERSSPVGGSFLLVALALGAWLGGTSGMSCAMEERSALLWGKLGHVGLAGFASGAYQLTRDLLRLDRRSRPLLGLGWVLSLLFAAVIGSTDALVGGVAASSSGRVPRYAWLGGPFLAFCLGMLALSLLHAIVEYKKARPGGTGRRRARMLALALGLACLGALDPLAAYGVPVYPFGSLGLVAFVAVAAGAVGRFPVVNLTPALAAKEIVASMKDPVLLCDEEGTIRFASRAAGEVFGCPERELVGRPLTSLVEGAGDGNARGPARDREAVARTPRGERVEVSLSLRALLDKGGRRLGTVVVARDLRERRRAEEALARQTEQLARQTEQLARSDAAFEQFAAVAAHDLKEPLRMVSSYAELLARRYKGRLDADADEFIAFVLDGARRMSALVDGLTTYSRVSMRPQAFAPTDCAAVLDQVCANLKKAVESSGAEITRGPLPTVTADETHLMQLFQNLVGNAIKYRAERPLRIDVRAERQGSEWRFSVRDNGIGIDPGQAERIFMLFQRLHRWSEYPGTGIGLSVCKKIVERHGGRIWVESEPGRGSTFHFTLSAEGRPPE